MRVAPRRIKTKLAAGAPAFGACVQLPSPDIVEIVGYAGLDFAWIDAEHGSMGVGEVNQLVRAADAAGIDAIVRVPDHNASFIQKVLDMGAAGIIAPHVRDVEVAQAVVAAARYAPEGVRGACPAVRAVGHLTMDWPATLRQIRDDAIVIGLIEDADGVANVEEIAAGSGLDGLIFGPYDLATELGLDGDVSDARVREMNVRVRKAALNAGIQYLALPGLDGAVGALMAEGVRLFNVTADRGLLFTAFESALAAAREEASA
ncbi:4-hydroxy-2-oxoheptanedioate aldolase [Kibdelosporangium banguiense]|uniref:4-hydroxy-2-oxoheptanedioate aldolase n=1 Tax=Kibdelosporangium banguiense TaxID=1365924 RepID=A0ABS4TX44_9PSEU|nr:aldolase/citrate lyase family protein [Kibdelosporangium banguiense]MBP2328941.1 4-hydroxy-2-oxoheptanedioate aldolase [Kibdelosporangium banguiense]